MRVGGLASGIDTDTLIRELMNAERIPLNKLEQNKVKTEWQRDAFRDVNKQIADLKDSLRDFRLNSSMVMGKTVTSSKASAVTATGNASAVEGSYKIKVTQMATNAMRVSKEDLTEEDIQTAIQDAASKNDGKVVFSAYDKESKAMKEYKITIDAADTMQSIAGKINQTDAQVRAFYDESKQTFVMETTQVGNYNLEGDEIDFGEDNSFFAAIFDLTKEELGGTNAKFTYNDHVELEAQGNSYTMNGIEFNFHNVTGEESAVLTVNTDVDAAVENIKEFVDKYNALVGTLRGSQMEPVYRDYPPLTEAEKEEMTDKQIELWEEKAKSGLLKGDRIINNATTNLRSTLYSQIESGGAFTLLTEIGIATTESYLDGGILEIDEDKLRKALTEDADSVHKLLVNSGEGAERGLFNRLEDTLDSTIRNIEDRAGKSTFTNEQFALGRDLDKIDERIEAFERRLQKTEDRYWRQFNAMEKAISNMNNQSAMLMSFTNPNM